MSKTDRAIQNLVDMLSHPPESSFVDPVAQAEADRQFDLLAAELAERDRQRRELWGDKYPLRAGAKPPQNPPAKPAAKNPVNTASKAKKR